MSEAIGAEFFSALVCHLRDALDAECVYVSEILPGKAGRVRTVAASAKPERMDFFELPLAGSPESEVAAGNSCVFPRGVQQIFPEDPLLRDLQIEACVGVPLNGSEGHACGVIAAFFREPLDLEAGFVQAMLNVFVPRAAAELNRKRADDTLRENEQRYRTFVELNPDACWRVEFDQPIDTALPEKDQVESILAYGRLAEGNHALAQKLGLDGIDQMIGKPMMEAMRDMKNAQACLQALIRSGYRRSTLEVTVLWQNKRCYYVHSLWGIVENGRLLRIWVSSRDVTELRELEAQFRHVQKLESIGRLATGVAHDFNNLLTVIQGFTSELLEKKDTADKVRSGLVEIQRAVEKGAALTNQLLTFSHRQTVQLQVLDLNSVVAEAEPMLRRLMGRKTELVMLLSPSPGMIRADSGYMHQVLLNLTMNARDAMPDGGRLIIAVANVKIGEDRPPQLASIEPGDYVRLSVADTGKGMTPDIQEHLFEPFFTTKGKGQGTGLGLSTVYGIIRQIGGHIVVQTEPNRGTTFEMFLPRRHRRA